MVVPTETITADELNALRRAIAHCDVAHRDALLYAPHRPTRSEPSIHSEDARQLRALLEKLTGA